MSDQLFAWGNTTKLGVGDHTWVTSSSDGTAKPTDGNVEYWYCWGVHHSSAEQLGMSTSGASFARKVAKPNDPSEDVGIKYGIDGLCHQMANRLLRFTNDDDTGKPIKVSRASGYQLSIAMYGEYGGTKLTPAGKLRLRKWERIVDNFQRQLESNK